MQVFTRDAEHLLRLAMMGSSAFFGDEHAIHGRPAFRLSPFRTLDAKALATRRLTPAVADVEVVGCRFVSPGRPDMEFLGQGSLDRARRKICPLSGTFARVDMHVRIGGCREVCRGKHRGAGADCGAAGEV